MHLLSRPVPEYGDKHIDNKYYYRNRKNHIKQHLNAQVYYQSNHHKNSQYAQCYNNFSKHRTEVQPAKRQTCVSCILVNIYMPTLSGLFIIIAICFVVRAAVILPLCSFIIISSAGSTSLSVYYGLCYYTGRSQIVVYLLFNLALI